MDLSSSQKTPNRLIHETSPYLLQHAYNPVDWYPWCQEALTLAQKADKPILLSIGYSACHWCHVMERESFEDRHIASLMNTHFVCIKVDREERPDLDDIYMQATLAMNQGQGGWPMTVFLTPDQKPLFAGTYFPPTERWGRPGFATVLQKIAEGWAQHRENFVEQATRFTSQLRISLQAPSPMIVGQDDLDRAITQFAEEFDPVYGGFGTAPKFPPATALSFLLRQYYRTKNDQTLLLITKTLDGMAAGGLYDHIGGGFARYSTDNQWLVPHFEKMLYDNALLSRTYAEAFHLTGSSTYQRIAQEVFDYILREMTSPEGGFYSSTDADSEGVEGKYFVWTPEEVSHILPNKEDAERFCAYYNITSQGNWEGTNIPHTPRSIEEVAEACRCSSEELIGILDRGRPLMYKARLTRVPPGLDDKIITAWNGMMIGSLAEGSRILRQPEYLTQAIRAADFLLKQLSRPDGGLYRTYRGGKAHLAGCLEDYAYGIEGLIDLYEAGASIDYLQQALRLAERILVDFSDDIHGGFYTTAKDHETLILRSREGPDGAIPSGNAVAASVLARLSFHFGREDFRDAATKAIRLYGQLISQAPRAFSKSLMVMDFLLHAPIELALISVPGQPEDEELRHIIHSTFLPNRIIAYHNPNESEPHHPLLRGKTPIQGKATLYICRDYACEAPLTDPREAKSALTKLALARWSQPARKTLTQQGISGHATPDGTLAYLNRISPHASSSSSPGWFTDLGSTGLKTSRLGFGCYRIDLSNEEHGLALHLSLQKGCNLIDTSTNYQNGDSERLVGKILREMVGRHELSREEVIVISKIGYVQGNNLLQAQSREKAGCPYPEMVKVGDDLWHCIHPEFLEDQLTLSLDRLGIATLDICLLHNPEYFLAKAKNRTTRPGSDTLQSVQQEFYRRLQEAFCYFEQQVAGGRIQWYGVSSNTCTALPTDPEATSLSRMIDMARHAAQRHGHRDHHFRVLQLPMNLFEAGALLTPNTGDQASHTVLEFAQRENIAILVNRPLNAIPSPHRGIVRLAPPPPESKPVDFEVQQPKVALLEEEFCNDFASLLPTSGKGMTPQDYFLWSRELLRIRTAVHDLQHWEQIEHRMIAPHVNQVMQVVSKHLSGPTLVRWQNWRDRYLPELLTLLRVMRSEASDKSREVAKLIATQLNPFLPEARRQEPLSRQALWILISTAGVTTVLNGMRTSSYVKDSMEVLQWPFLSNPDPIYKAVKDKFPV